MNKTALITGSGRGIGFAIAKEFLLNGYNVMINASKSKSELNDSLKELNEISKCNFMANSFLCDVSKYGQCMQLYQKCIESFGQVDVLVNNAGISHIGLFTDMKPNEIANIINVNLMSVMNMSHIVLPEMVKKKCGSIINISSIWGESGASCEAVYSASKGGVNSFTKALAKEYGPSGIRVNAISCGVIKTKMNSFLSKEEELSLIEGISLMRFGQPSEIAKAAFFLADELHSSFITGQILGVDGGQI